MTKKLKNLLTLAILCAYAMPDGHTYSPSWHMGAGAGWSWLNADTDISLKDDVVTVTPFSSSKDTFCSGTMGQLFLGYTSQSQNSFFSFDVGGSLSNLTHDVKHYATHYSPPIDLSFHTQLKKDWGINVSIKWGWARPVLQPYVKLGFSWNHLTSTYKDLSSNTAKEHALSGKVQGYGFGGGIQLPLSNRVLVFVEYMWMFLQDISFTLDFMSRLNTAKFVHKVANASTHNLGIGIMLKF